MRGLLSGLVALVTAVLLSSCALVPFGTPDTPATSASPDTLYVDSFERADDRMEQIVAAVNEHDAAALKAMFSTRALERATDIDARLDDLLSLFPNGGLTRKPFYDTGAERQYKNGELTEVLLARYKVTADGIDYSLFLADFTVNEVIDPDNVGLYALGVTPWIDDSFRSCSDPFHAWACSIHADESDENGYPGVYVPQQP